MALQMVDRGDSYHVIYLGSCMLSHMSTGLGVLQKPLRELYFRYRQSGGGPAAQERYLRMSARGMAMTYKESASSQPTEVFYAMPSILFWDAVQFCTVRGGTDKRLRGAFEPVDNDHSRNKDNLFTVLEKKYHFLQQMTHPPLFTCVLRRTQGVKALDVHAFVCSSDDEALGLVRSLHTVHAHYKTDETVETGVFGYRPFSSPGGPTVGTGPGAGGGDTAGGPTWAPDGDGGGSGGGSGGGGQGLMGSGSGSGSASMPGSLQHRQHQQQEEPPPRPARPLSLGRRTGGQVQVLPTTAPDSHQLRSVKPQSIGRLSSHGLSSSLSSLASTGSGSSTRAPVYQLTQEDFRKHNAALYLHDRVEDDVISNVDGQREKEQRRTEEQSPDSDDGHHVYQYIRHLNSPPEPSPREPSPTQPPTQPVIRNRNFKQAPSPSSTTPTHNNNGSIERDTVARSRAMVQETLANQHQSISRNLNQLFSQTQSQADQKLPSKRATIFGAPFTRDQPQQQQPQQQPQHQPQQQPQYSQSSRAVGDRGGSGGGKLGQAYGHNASGGSGSGGGSFLGADPYDERRSQSRPYGGGDGGNTPSRRGSNGSVDTESLRQPVPPPRPAERMGTPSSRSREDVRPRSAASVHGSISGSQHGSPFAARNNTPDAPARPVAKVPPHKVTGVKVFPGGGAPAVGNLKATQSPVQRTPSSAFIDDRKQPPRRPKSQYFDEPQYMDESSSSGSSPSKSPPPASNWAFSGRGDDSGTGTMSGDRTNEDGTMNEKLLLSKKKDAEIASVLQNLKFDYDGTTMSPGLPAGNNFEKSLGYFP